MRTNVSISALAVLLLVAAPAAAGNARTATLDVPVAGMACEGCAANIKNKVGAVRGVKSIEADHKKARVVVVYDPGKVTEKRLRKTITDLGYVISEKDPPVVYPDGADVKTISKKGEDVRVKRYLARGKVTVVDFYADWCKPCKALDRRLARKVGENLHGLAVRKVNIVTWETPVAKRYLKNISGLPHIHIYDQKGKLVVKLSQDKVDQLDRYLAKLDKRARN